VVSLPERFLSPDLSGEAAQNVKANPDNVTSRSNLIPVGQQAPDFTAPLSDGATLTLSSLRGLQRVVLVFYPGDNTPVCTAQLCALRDHWVHFQAQDTLVYGVNPAGVAGHARFAANHGFPFPLIADLGAQIAAAYGCRLIFGLVKRTVYVVDRLGRIAYAQRGNPAPAEVLQALEHLHDDPAPTR
jgi:peroxiredoxin Q/BCP